MATATNIYRKSGSSPQKPLGQYLIEAGLLNESQINVALIDQQVTGMRFGEIVVARGWMKEQTVEYLMKKVVVPERKRQEVRQRQMEQQTVLQQKTHVHSRAAESASVPNASSKEATQSSSGFKRKDPPVAKPLPSVNSVDSDVSWVG